MTWGFVQVLADLTPTGNSPVITLDSMVMAFVFSAVVGLVATDHHWQCRSCLDHKACPSACARTVAGGIFAAEHSDVVMVSYSADYRDEEPVIRRAAELSKGVLIKKGLGSGTLPASRSLQENLRPVFALNGVSSLIAGTINRQHLRENVSAAIASAR